MSAARPNEKTDKEADRRALPEQKYSFRVSQFVFLSDVEMRSDQPLFKDLGVLREQVYRDLRLPPSNTEVFVCLFEDQRPLRKIHAEQSIPICHQAACVLQIAHNRGGLGGSEDLLVYTYWGDRIQQDLRHELTHALLHSVLKDVPIWLDEGLAEYFEVPANWNGANAKHLEQLRQAGVRFDLDRLEKLKEVNQMSPAEYRESWAWVHLMLRSTPQAKQALLSYLQELRTNPDPGPLRPRLAPAFQSLDRSLQTHLAEPRRRKPSRNATAKQ